MARWHKTSLAFLLLGWLLAGCGTTTTSQRLRLVNAGKVDIEQITVIFPGGQVDFGKVAVGATTEYREFAQGVYGYAAYNVTINGKTVSQPVVDWVGESPLAGKDFTYTLDFDPQRAEFAWINLLKVERTD